MIDNILQRLAEVERRLSNVFLIGTITDADYDNALVKVEAGKLETGWLHWVTARASNDVDYWAPEIGEQVLVMSPGGDPELGVVLPALYQNDFPSTDTRPTIRRVRFADGADFSYDRQQSALTLNLPSGSALAITCDDALVNADSVTLNANGINLGQGGAGVVTGQCIDTFTGAPFASISSTVKAAL